MHFNLEQFLEKKKLKCIDCLRLAPYHLSSIIVLQVQSHYCIEEHDAMSNTIQNTANDQRVLNFEMLMINCIAIFVSTSFELTLSHS